MTTEIDPPPVRSGGGRRYHGGVLVLVWSAIISLSLSWNLWQVRAGAIEAAQLTARASFEKDLIYRLWNASHGGVYVRNDSDSRPNPYLDPELRSVRTEDGTELTLMNPAYMTRQVFELAETHSGIKSHITSLKPLNPGNVPDPWEAQALLRLERGEAEVSQLTQIDGVDYLRLVRSLNTDAACLSCHATQGYSEGDVRGGISVRVPMRPYQEAQWQQIQSLSIGHGVLWVLGLVGIVSAIRRYRRQLLQTQENELRAKEHATLQLVMNGVAEPIVMIDAEFRIRMCNPAARQFYADLCENSECYRAIHRVDAPCGSSPHSLCPLEEARRLRRPVTIVHEHADRHGHEHIVELLATPLWDERGQFKGVIKVARDITDRVRAERKLKHLALHDPLTQLPNRLNFEDSLHQQLNREEAGMRLALLFIDLDRFKNINDTLGHPVGDEVLVEVARRLRQVIGHRGLLARFGGDEFTVLLAHGQASQPQIAALAQQLLERLAQPLRIQEYDFFISASIGVSLYPEDGHGLTELMRSADAALYRAKNLGRNTIQFYDPHTDAQAFQRLRLEARLKLALDGPGLDIMFQPLVRADNSHLLGMEALTHWHHPEFGYISPGEFIPIAEETGLIMLLGRQVLRQACAQCKKWNQRLVRPLRVAVNVSPRQFLHQDIVQEVSAALDLTGLEPQYLEIEITESAVIQDLDAAITTLRRLRGMGVGVALDDFGTGYSSLNYLKRLPISKLKIDQSFIRDVAHERIDAAVVKTIIELAHHLDMQVVAEGVETPAQQEFLQRQGCDILQGYLFSKPVVVGEFEARFIVPDLSCRPLPTQSPL